MRYALLPLSTVLALSTWVAAESAPAFAPSAVEGIFVEQFIHPTLGDRWSASRATKEEKQGEVFSYVGKWAVEEPTVYPGLENDYGLVLSTKAAHHAISAPLDQVFDPKGKPLVLSYEVKLQNGLDCGGAYVKLLSESDEGIHAEEFSDKTPYTIMFGPDRCGATSKVHFIFRHKNPLTGEIEEKHLKSPPAPKITKTTAVYTLIVRPEDQTYEIRINNEKAKSGSLLEDFTPAVNPPKEIDDPEDVKPSDWVETPKISDPDATKPADWDEDAPASIEAPDAEIPADWLENEPATVPDPDAEKPEEWSDEDDGDWIAPQVPNPKCEGVSGCGPWKRPEIPNPEFKGKWFAPLIDNPDYKGPWSPRKIPNPSYYEDLTPADFSPIAGLGFELWSMTDGILFDNIYLGTSEQDLEQFISDTYAVKAPIEQALETADKAKEEEAAKKLSASTDADEPDVKADPVGWAKFKAQQFFNEAHADPKKALVERPLTGGVLGVVFATLIGMLGVVLSLIMPGSAAAAAPKAKKQVQAAAQAVADKAAEVVDKVKEDVPVAEAAEQVHEVAEGVRTRATRAKVAAQENAKEASL
ncbi:hypothetical protein JCM10908_005289 [Rhodotorula pacifica]|uniref:calnexin n=1 Tax=Rhodotorula pacifica TaxID=1495444 RepID=UPI003180E223